MPEALELEELNPFTDEMLELRDELNELIRKFNDYHRDAEGPENYGVFMGPNGFKAGVMELALEVPAGNVTGIAAVNKFGLAQDVDQTTDTDLWDGADGTTSTDVWVPPTTARTHDLVSSSTADDAGQTGMITVTIEGLDANWALQSETVTLDGTSNAATANTYLRIFRMYGATWGSGKENAGIIKATAQTDGTVTAAIQTGRNQTLMAVYTVPASKTLYLTGYYATVESASPAGWEGNINLLIKYDASVANAGYRTAHVQGISAEYPIFHQFQPYIKITEKSDIVLRATDGSADNAKMSGGFDGYLVDD